MKLAIKRNELEKLIALETNDWKKIHEFFKNYQDRVAE